MSSKLAQKTAALASNSQPIAGVVVAAPETKFSHPLRSGQSSSGQSSSVAFYPPGTLAGDANCFGSTGQAVTGQTVTGQTTAGRLPAGMHLPAGMYVFPTPAGAGNPLNELIVGLAKAFSVQLAASIHPHVGTGVRAGWIVFGAVSLFKRASQENIPWHEVALEGGELAVDALATANAALPNDFQFSADWTEGAGLLLAATKHAADGGDANQFVFNKAIDQTLPAELARKFVSLAIAAQHPDPKFGALSVIPIDIKSPPLRRPA
ncbi:MAG: hypothetical protein KDB00_17055 [Planctomycetales bacterium]|nr:hypothetical protein [Planctomycetales bacterium]